MIEYHLAIQQPASFVLLASSGEHWTLNSSPQCQLSGNTLILFNMAEKALSAAVTRHTNNQCIYITQYNDFKDTTLPDIHNIFDEAIVTLEEQYGQ